LGVPDEIMKKKNVVLPAGEREMGSLKSLFFERETGSLKSLFFSEKFFDDYFFGNEFVVETLMDSRFMSFRVSVSLEFGVDSGVKKIKSIKLKHEGEIVEIFKDFQFLFS